MSRQLIKNINFERAEGLMKKYKRGLSQYEKEELADILNQILINKKIQQDNWGMLTILPVLRKLRIKKKYYHHEYDHDQQVNKKMGGWSFCKKCGVQLVVVCISNVPYSPYKTCPIKEMRS